MLTVVIMLLVFGGIMFLVLCAFVMLALYFFQQSLSYVHFFPQPEIQLPVLCLGVVCEIQNF